MAKLIIAKMNINGKPCTVCALAEGSRILELRVEPDGRKSLLQNIYVGRVENLAVNIRAAFVLLGDGVMGHFPLSGAEKAIFSSGRKGQGPLRPGDELLVQVNRDAMKGKLPSLTSDLNLAGKYLALTTGNRNFGYSAKLSKEEKARLSKWLSEAYPEEPAYGLVVRTNAGQASKEEFLHELAYLQRLYKRTVTDGRSRTCFSLLYEAEPFYIAAIRDTYSESLEEIVTDSPEIHERAAAYLADFSPGEQQKLRLYTDRLLPLYKLYRLENALDEVRREKIWLDSGGFVVIQQTEAFVCIDVNSGKYTGKKKAEETYRKINLEAAQEIARQIRLRNLSGIILIDFINMENPDHTEELFHVLQKHLKRDPVRSSAVDITPLHILEMTRRKVRRPVIEELRELE